MKNNNLIKSFFFGFCLVGGDVSIMLIIQHKYLNISIYINYGQPLLIWKETLGSIILQGGGGGRIQEFLKGGGGGQEFSN